MLEQRSGVLNSLLALLDSIPEDSVAISVYLFGSLLVLWCWFGIAQRLPRPLGKVTWIIVFTILLTPTVSEGPNASIAPAIFGLLFGGISKNLSLIFINFSSMLFVMGMCFVLSHFWVKITASRKQAPL